ncbi:MAG TPA: phenylalanine--tRNA ligase subunit beta [Ignavibacteriaceae bacterium]|nr:phenylalanine--tRNA ligase subunit beta [Ignavibacteriaceae bacterium]
MKISLNWLKNYIDLSGIPIDEIESALTMVGLEVENVENQEKMFNNFVIGYVKEKNKHPKADKLTVCIVSTGDEEHTVVCGAPNVDAGQKIVLALPGAIVPQNGIVISKAKIRGVESNGMICSEAELGIGNDHSGILVLDSSLKEGMTLSEAMQLNDVIFEIGITPNRPDALSHIGVARDLAALYNRKMNLPETKQSHSEKNVSEFASVEVEDAINCPRYSAKVVLNVEIKDSPLWLQQRIKSIGLRPINNVVDVTNFILYELGQPLHAFDLDRLSGKKIVVKKAGAVSDFVTLDSKQRKLTPETLLICDAKNPVAIAGVMGGENSEVTTATQNVLIESAYFNPSSVRKTSKTLGLSTDSSYRFERGCNPHITPLAAERAAQLIAEMSGGEIVEGLIDVYPAKILPKEISLRKQQVERILGYPIPDKKIRNIFIGLGFEILSEDKDCMFISVPPFRPDIEREIDLIEEIARINGYDNIPTISRIGITLQEKIDETSFTSELKEILSGLGFNEMYSTTLQGEKSANLTGNAIKLLNPSSIEMSFLRTSLIPGGIETVKKNLNVKEKNIMLFEIGKVFQKVNEKIESFDDFIEQERLLVLLAGNANEKKWYASERNFDFFDLKGYVFALFKKKNLDNFIPYSYNNVGKNLFDFCFEQKYENRVIGYGGRISKEVLKGYDIDKDVYCYELIIDEFKKLSGNPQKFKELLRYPKIQRDFAFVFDKKIEFTEIESFIRKNSSGLLKELSLFDVFESESLGSDKRSLAFSLAYYDYERTLTEEEVEKEFYNLIEKIKIEYKAVLRGV